MPKKPSGSTFRKLLKALIFLSEGKRVVVYSQGNAGYEKDLAHRAFSVCLTAELDIELTDSNTKLFLRDQPGFIKFLRYEKPDVGYTHLRGLELDEILYDNSVNFSKA